MLNKVNFKGLKCRQKIFTLQIIASWNNFEFHSDCQLWWCLLGQRINKHQVTIEVAYPAAAPTPATTALEAADRPAAPEEKLQMKTPAATLYLIFFKEYLYYVKENVYLCICKDNCIYIFFVLQVTLFTQDKHLLLRIGG